MFDFLKVKNLHLVENIIPAETSAFSLNIQLSLTVCAKLLTTNESSNKFSFIIINFGLF